MVDGLSEIANADPAPLTSQTEFFSGAARNVRVVDNGQRVGIDRD
jgi:hypothetical protein